MQIRLDKIGDDRFTWHETLEIGVEGWANAGVRDLSPVECRGSIQPTLSGFVLEIRLKYSLVLDCVRCLEPQTFDMEATVDLLVAVGSEGDRGERPQPSTVQGAVAGEDLEELSNDDLGVLILSDSILETLPLVTEQVQLGIPMKPLCREDCAGLCGECGANLNEGPCDCQPVIDPRWSALRKLADPKTET